MAGIFTLVVLRGYPFLKVRVFSVYRAYLNEAIILAQGYSVSRAEVWFLIRFML